MTPRLVNNESKAGRGRRSAVVLSTHRQPMIWGRNGVNDG
jgi:hypothetical protein